MAPSRKIPVTFITKLTSFLSCLSQQCFYITELSSRLSKAWECSPPRVYALLDVSPTYFDLQAWQTNSYVTPVLRHHPLPSVQQRRQSALTHRFCLKESDLCSMALRVVPDCSTTLNDLKICGFDLSQVPAFKLGTRRCWHENHSVKTSFPKPVVMSLPPLSRPF